MKKVWLAVLLNVLIPGIGHMYVGKFFAGFGLLIGIPILFAVFPIGAVVIWLGSVIVVGIDTAIDSPQTQPKEKKKTKETKEIKKYGVKKEEIFDEDGKFNRNATVLTFKDASGKTRMNWYMVIPAIIALLLCLAWGIRYIVTNL